jgi:hypothetical protein
MAKKGLDGRERDKVDRIDKDMMPNLAGTKSPHEY